MFMDPIDHFFIKRIVLIIIKFIINNIQTLYSFVRQKSSIFKNLLFESGFSICSTPSPSFPLLSLFFAIFFLSIFIGFLFTSGIKRIQLLNRSKLPFGIGIVFYRMNFAQHTIFFCISNTQRNTILKTEL